MCCWRILKSLQCCIPLYSQAYVLVKYDGVYENMKICLNFWTFIIMKLLYFLYNIFLMVIFDRFYCTEKKDQYQLFREFRKHYLQCAVHPLVLTNFNVMKLFKSIIKSFEVVLIHVFLVFSFYCIHIRFEF